MSKTKESHIKECLNTEFLFRQVQIDNLYKLLIEDDEVLPPCIFVHGLASTGKTSLINRFLFYLKKERSVNVSIINCVCCYSPRYLFEPILKDLLETKNIDLSYHCETFMQFLNALKNSNVQNEKTIIVLDKCEVLEYEQIMVFSKLQELIQSFQLCVILISQVSPAKFNDDFAFLPVIFEQFNSSELSEILALDNPVEWSLDFYKNFLNVFVGSFYGNCRDLVELKHLAELVFVKYIEPIKDGSCIESNQNLLYRKISPTIQYLSNCVYLGTSIDSLDSLNNVKSKFEMMALDLPYYAKYFLISAYIASFNSPKYDRRLFVKGSDKRKKKLNMFSSKRTENTTSELVGPKIFSLDRLLAIFYAIIDENTSMTANLLAQVNTLADLGLLVRLGDGKLDTPKYKCSVGYDCVNNIARTVKFNINKYLVDGN
ncbi:origin recognition complex subunit 5 isoform X2 [Daktulosphaira vitifoliae]|uniref:origin recognition complex subunit 5 isoform X2 n=1 Tax=Daktulosphaira vitifoliae TaxID=58002 RepID=UPI0021A9D1C3|nr:origin recognition complex subunit 5 isoform X2 [Daktulosphaira vitifoliae]